MLRIQVRSRLSSQAVLGALALSLRVLCGPLPGSPHELEVPADTTVTTEHTVTVDGETIPYATTAGTSPVYDGDNEAIASTFYVYYRRTDVDDTDRRPLTFSFNGGPGSASVWMHIGEFIRASIPEAGMPARY